mmetsp:Transcript_13566/g.48621  ORF Transcript_13566/g.48621 Transcript_13566/m.48621 type:complete len:201 (-) Transcript_13566:1170-1772(-)
MLAVGRLLLVRREPSCRGRRRQRRIQRRLHAPRRRRALRAAAATSRVRDRARRRGVEAGVHHVRDGRRSRRPRGPERRRRGPVERVQRRRGRAHRGGEDFLRLRAALLGSRGGRGRGRAPGRPALVVVDHHALHAASRRGPALVARALGAVGGDDLEAQEVRRLLPRVQEHRLFRGYANDPGVDAAHGEDHARARGVALY